MSEFRARKVLWNHLISAFLSGFGLPISGNTLHLSLSCFDMTMPLCTKPAPLGSFFQFGVEELNWTNLRPIQHVWNWNSDVIAQLQCWTTPMQLWLHWNKLLLFKFQNLVESHPSGSLLLYECMNACGFRLIIFWCNAQMSTQH